MDASDKRDEDAEVTSQDWVKEAVFLLLIVILCGAVLALRAAGLSGAPVPPPRARVEPWIKPGLWTYTWSGGRWHMRLDADGTCHTGVRRSDLEEWVGTWIWDQKAQVLTVAESCLLTNSTRGAPCTWNVKLREERTGPEPEHPLGRVWYWGETLPGASYPPGISVGGLTVVQEGAARGEKASLPPRKTVEEWLVVDVGTGW